MMKRAPTLGVKVALAASMKGKPQAEGTAGGRFPKTDWSALVRLGKAGEIDQRRILETVFRQYWRPAYQYLRAMRPVGDDAAKDMVQEFFTTLLARGGLHRLAPEKGSFRAFLGMSVVYEARDPDRGRPVAVKVIRDGLLDQLRNEANAAARLRYPGIVAVHEVGPGFIVMDYVEGSSLDHALAGLTLEEKLRIFEAVVRAVEYAHAQGVVHRDIKPGNVLLEADGHVRLTDFGLAGIIGDKDAHPGSLIGTPHYMAPEQVRGQAPGPAADIWALC